MLQSGTLASTQQRIPQSLLIYFTLKLAVRFSKVSSRWLYLVSGNLTSYTNIFKRVESGTIPDAEAPYPFQGKIPMKMNSFWKYPHLCRKYPRLNLSNLVLIGWWIDTNLVCHKATAIGHPGHARYGLGDLLAKYFSMMRPIIVIYLFIYSFISNFPPFLRTFLSLSILT